MEKTQCKEKLDIFAKQDMWYKVLFQSFISIPDSNTRGINRFFMRRAQSKRH
jgi:hypothetical protein